MCFHLLLRYYSKPGNSQILLSWDVDMYIQLLSGPIWVSSFKSHSAYSKFTVFSWISGFSFYIPNLFQLMASLTKPYPLPQASHSIRCQFLFKSTFWVFLESIVIYSFTRSLAALTRPGAQGWGYWNEPGGPKRDTACHTLCGFLFRKSFLTQIKTLTLYCLCSFSPSSSPRSPLWPQN